MCRFRSVKYVAAGSSSRVRHVFFIVLGNKTVSCFRQHSAVFINVGWKSVDWFKPCDRFTYTKLTHFLSLSHTHTHTHTHTHKHTHTHTCAQHAYYFLRLLLFIWRKVNVSRLLKACSKLLTFSKFLRWYHWSCLFIEHANSVVDA